jgi:polyisoprenoid-binding protein YceI
MMIRSATRWLAAACLLAAQGAAFAQPARYEIDPEHFSVGFLVDHIGYAKVLGMFRNANGAYSFDEATGALSDVRIVIDAKSVFTNQRKRDQHLNSADFLNSGEFPEIVFKGAKAKRTGERTFVVEGQLDLIGKTQPVTLNVTWNKSGQYELPGAKAYAMGVSARGSFKRSAFGMNYAVANGWVGDTVELILEFEARRK